MWHLRASKIRKRHFKLFAAIDLYSVNCGHVNRPARRAAEFENIMAVASKSGPVETRPTVLVATALLYFS